LRRIPPDDWYKSGIGGGAAAATGAGQQGVGLGGVAAARLAATLFITARAVNCWREITRICTRRAE
jgi:hypothetical protein